MASGSPLCFVSVVVLAVLVVVATVLVRRALLISPSDKNAVPALAAGITLTGVLTTAGVTLVGLLLRQSIDLRTAKLAAMADQRADVEQNRLAMQTVMETVKALTGPNGQAAPPVQASSALIALAKLEQLPLALDLAAELWPTGQLTARAGSGLCDDALQTKDPRLCRIACILINNNWMNLKSASGQVEWPSSLRSWPAWLNEECVGLVTISLENWLATVPAKSTDDFRQRLVDTSPGRRRLTGP